MFVDYKPAELKENKTWEIVYYVIDPNFPNDGFKRKRERVTPFKNKTERRKQAKRRVADINENLKNGWNPFLELENSKKLVKLQIALHKYIERCKIELNDGNLRPDTFRTYNSQVKQLEKYLIFIKKTDLLVVRFNEDFISAYLEYIRYDLKRAAKTRDNYLSFLKTLSTYFLKQKYIIQNPTINFSKTNKKVKIRTIIDSKTREKIFSYWDAKNSNFLTLCLVCYYCLIRRTELTKLRVKHINLLKSTLFIPASIAKNRKNAHVTIPNKLKPILRIHLKDANPNDYLFSSVTFKPGTTKLTPMSITKRWAYMRNQLGIDGTIHWYSLKDTGITDLLRAGVPLIAVRDQARHSSSSQTDEYTPRDMKVANTDIRESSIKFI